MGRPLMFADIEEIAEIVAISVAASEHAGLASMDVADLNTAISDAGFETQVVWSVLRD